LGAPGLFRSLVLRPINDIGLNLLLLEKRLQFLYRDQFDATLRDPLFAACQFLLNAGRKNEGLALAEEKPLEDEERYIRDVIDQLTAFIRDTWLPGGAQRFGQTKTYGVLRGEFTVGTGLPEHLRRGVFAVERTYPAWVRFSGPGPYAPPDIEDFGQCCVAIKLMDVPGPKLMEDERFTQDLILVSPPSFITPNIRENSKLQRQVRAKTPILYFLNPLDTHLLAFIMQSLYSRAQANPLEIPYYSNVPFLLGEGQAVQYSLRPSVQGTSRVPARPSDNYLREAMVRTLSDGDWTFDFMVQVQTDAHRMPVEDATVKWPERLSPYVTVAQLRLPAQRFDSDAQLAFADNLSYNPWHSLPEHRPLGNSNRARKQMYLELSKLRQAMNATPHVEPTGQEVFPAADGGEAAARRRPEARKRAVAAAGAD
jgi:hypothetical protein